MQLTLGFYPLAHMFYASRKLFGIQEFFEKQKLTDPTSLNGTDNYFWYFNEDNGKYLDHPIPVAPLHKPGQQVPLRPYAVSDAWVKGQSKTKSHVPNKLEQERLQTVREFHTVQSREGQSVSSHALKQKGYIDNLERLGQPFVKTLQVSLILDSLNKDNTTSAEF
ncbi:hypothetical protein Tco_0884425 [Tanacetum coccineum]